MRKLKLESLQVESFETTGPTRAARGTVEGHADVGPGTGGTGVSFCIACQPWSADLRCEPATYNVRDCGETQYFDCTFGCTRYETCGYQYCAIENSQACEVK